MAHLYQLYEGTDVLVIPDRAVIFCYSGIVGTDSNVIIEHMKNVNFTLSHKVDGPVSYKEAFNVSKNNLREVIGWQKSEELSKEGCGLANKEKRSLIEILEWDHSIDISLKGKYDAFKKLCNLSKGLITKF